jgi:hypothetical protein
MPRLYKDPSWTSQSSHVKYLGAIFDKRVTWRLHIEIIEAKTFRTFIRICSLPKSEYLSVSIMLTLHKSLNRSGMTYACCAWEFAADTYLLKLVRLQNKVPRTTGNFFQDAHRPLFTLFTIVTYKVKSYRVLMYEYIFWLVVTYKT